MTNLKPVKIKSSNDNVSVQRRQYERREHDFCMIQVDGHPFPVTDWSQGGVLFEADGKFFTVGQKLNMVMRFRMGDTTQDIKVGGKIVRVAPYQVATQFESLSQDVHNAFDDVIEANSLSA